MHLIELIKSRNDRSRLIKHLSHIDKYDEAKLIADYEKDPGFLRFCIIQSLITFLFYAYHLTKNKPASNRSRKVR